MHSAEESFCFSKLFVELLSVRHAVPCMRFQSAKWESNTFKKSEWLVQLWATSRRQLMIAKFLLQSETPDDHIFDGLLGEISS